VAAQVGKVQDIGSRELAKLHLVSKLKCPLSDWCFEVKTIRQAARAVRLWQGQ
jgi:hypothetical protein